MQGSSGFQRFILPMRLLSRNAKLFLVSTALQGLNFGIWGVLFNLYLGTPEVGFLPNFIGNVFMVGALATGFVALPAGLLCERIGPRKAMLISLASNFISLIEISVLESSAIFLASTAAGLIGTIGWVANAPFMAENSSEQERTHLFSYSWALFIITGVAGSLVGGALPDLFNNYLGLSTGLNGSAVGYRISLAISACVALTAFVPIMLTREKRGERNQRMADVLVFRNIKNWRTIIKFAIPTAIIGFGAGFIVPLFNIFFSERFHASADQVGIMSALSNVTLGIGTLAAPALSKRISKAKSVALCEYLSMPFIMLTALSPSLAWSASAYVARNALMNMAAPVGTSLQMELVSEPERATTNGIMVGADNIPRAITASFSGAMMTKSDFLTPFIFTTITYFVASTIYFIFFRDAESQAAKKDPKT